MKTKVQLIILLIMIITIQPLNSDQTVKVLAYAQTSKPHLKTMDNTLSANYNFEVNYTHQIFIIDQVLPITSDISPAYTILVIDTQGNWNNFGGAF